MATFFNAGEVFQFAVRIEENGEKFYRRVAETAGDADVRSVFSFLADEEVKHRETFRELLSKIEDFKPTEMYPGEYFAYLKAYADQIIFSSKLDEDLPERADASSAVEFGIRRELDSILYYLEMKNVVPEGHRETVDRIVQEERKHFAKLSRLQEQISDKGNAAA